MRDQWTSDFGRELLAQREWLGGLAYALVRDAAEAEDLVQETWMAALRSRPSTEGGLRGWLSTVLRNRASRAARDRHRRDWQERLAARDDRDTSTRDVAERAWTQQAVAAAVMALDEPYRETILLRFYEELPPRAIALEMDVPVSTVKTRLSRGLERLANRLDEGCGGDRRQWLGSLVALIEAGTKSSVWPVTGPMLAAWTAGVAAVGACVVVVPDESAPESAARSEVSWRLLNSSMDIESPGMVTIPGGRTLIGTESRELMKLLNDSPEAMRKLRGFRAETPKHEVVLEEFRLMQRQVTNEQYREYVQATGALPPLLWGEEAIGKARTEFLEQDARRRIEAKRAGVPAPEREVFDAHDWWMAHGKNSEWEMPQELSSEPVVYVNFEDAERYAKWAGLRLPTEFEFEHAARTETDQDFSFGNVWEWTSSSYTPYPGWNEEALSFEEWAPREALDSVPNFDPIRRVVRGGSAQNGALSLRASTRGGFDPEQRASVLGFRCASSDPVREISRRALDSLRASRPIPGLPLAEVEFGAPLGLVGWRSRGPERRPRVPKVQGQAVIQDFAALVIHPASHVQPVDLSNASEPSFLALLTTADKIVSPELAPGSWAVFLEPGNELSQAPILFVSLDGKHVEVRTTGDWVRDPIAKSGVDAASDRWLRLRTVVGDRTQHRRVLSLELELEPGDWQILVKGR